MGKNEGRNVTLPPAGIRDREANNLKWTPNVYHIYTCLALFILIPRIDLIGMSAGKEVSVTEEFGRLVEDLVKIYNPQHIVAGRPGEAALADFIVDWCREHNLQYEIDLSWGILITLRIACPEFSDDAAPGVLLSAHLDSDHLHYGDLRSVKRKHNNLVYKGKVGLDCKTGVAIILQVLLDLQAQVHSGKNMNVYAMFTVGEESGQKGAIRAPILQFAGKVRYGIVVDRMTSGAGAPKVMGKCVRHVVGTYKSVPLMEASTAEELMFHLIQGMAFSGAPLHEQTLLVIESPNCADAIEWRGRFDCEVIAQVVLRLDPDNMDLRDATDCYFSITNSVKESMDRVPSDVRVSGMNEWPRIDRYKVMQIVYNLLYASDKDYFSVFPTILDEYRFSCVNLSYDYNDSNRECSLCELRTTANIILGCILSYSTFSAKR